MAIGELCKYYADFLEGHVEEKLNDPKLGKQDFGKVLVVVQRIDRCQGLEEILPEQAATLYGKIFKLYPEFEKDLKAELEKKHPG